MQVCEKKDSALPAEISMAEFLGDQSYFSVPLYHNDSPDANRHSYYRQDGHGRLIMPLRFPGLIQDQGVH